MVQALEKHGRTLELLYSSDQHSQGLTKKRTETTAEVLIPPSRVGIYGNRENLSKFVN
jgi:hypothetical protein